MFNIKSRARPFEKKQIFLLLIPIILAITLWSVILEVGGWEALPSVLGMSPLMISAVVFSTLAAVAVVYNRKLHVMILILVVGGLTALVSVPVEMMILGLAAVVLGLAIVAVFEFWVFPLLGRTFSGMYLPFTRRNESITTLIQNLRNWPLEVFNALKPREQSFFRRPLPHLLL